ncbi:glycyl-tRNA synthetase beta chain [Herbihabitans rhizosphaerae]|uniref:Multifunctional fusion protein n=1 Tax=Herbihabitans rhizosphaerae TaxID=1872711 RepID=A0A4Q7KCJ9_9PSEU|nr:glycine--tRNA ligase [Herbihabitans rhizosphaerae]RZS29618.1 glycyl-tRNA synthetase beta chain [Herbihabitans rhizosphaerae]
MRTLQDALLALTSYWTERGCMIAQPFNTEVGAGTLNPATILRVLGPEPWHVAYVEPSVRPDDGRYGENPNRLQTHTQYQVILKPDPGNPQELYLGSLEALGVDLKAHDIRFVEDNWANPATGSWGLGWEVWLDGLEITQFTYFQQAGGLTLNPISVEITYGIERILMALQGVSHFKDIAYAPGISYGEVFAQAEYEMSRYYLDDADIESNRALFESYATEGERLIELRLPVPAYTCMLKCSHVFNVLDARGAVSTTERARAFGRMRKLARDVAQLWVERRAELEHPLGLAPSPEPAVARQVSGPSEPATLLFEIGLEELPAGEVPKARARVREELTTRLAATKLPHGEITTYSTPRRVVAIVSEVAPREPDTEQTNRGPKAAVAFDADGKPTKAGEGFARKHGVDPSTLDRVTADGVEYVAVRTTVEGREAPAVLSEVLGHVVRALRADRNMRWNDSELAYSRPVRWLLALLGDVPLSVAVSSLGSGTTTRVHRTADEPVVSVASADGYPEFLAAQGIELDASVRKEAVVAQAIELAASAGGTVDLVGEAALVDEVTNLVERPNAVLGSYEQSYLDLPGDVLTTVMRKHQRYLPVRASDGSLLPHFVAVANGDCDHDVVRAGNESVLRARFADAEFFFNHDLAVPPATMKEKLASLAFADGLGSVADRALRIARIAEALSDRVDLAAGDRKVVTRAGELAKFDLGSQMVVEMTSLAGTMATEYARRAGEPEEVAVALREMEQPRSTDDPVAATVPGAVLALADRFDLLVGLFATGAKPTGSSDPYGLRRAALGVVKTLREQPPLGELTVTDGLTAAAAVLREQGVEVADGVVAEAADFVLGRYTQLLLDEGGEHGKVTAVRPLGERPVLAEQTLRYLDEHEGDAVLAAAAEAMQRVRRILASTDAVEPSIDREYLSEPAESALAETVTETRKRLGENGYTLADFVGASGALVDAINRFFDDIMVMDSRPQVRAARLGLLTSVRTLGDGLIDWDALGSTAKGAKGE